MKYPNVRGEFVTLRALQSGYSIARFGDGEFKMADGKSYVREPANREISNELRQVLTNPHPKCIVGIPTMDPAGPKFESWDRHRKRFATMLNPDLTYFSAFISRPDSAPWIRTPTFAGAMRSLWEDKRTAVVCERKGSAYRAVKNGARESIHIECPQERAYAEIDRFEQEIVEWKAEIAILSVGPTATCLANRLAARGIQAIDFGSGGKFIAELL